MENCLFCKIVKGEIPSKKVKETEDTIAFEDIAPQAPTHILLVPKFHLGTLLELNAKNRGWLGNACLLANEIARERKIADSGFRLVINCNPDGGQTVFHLHIHMLGGRPMTWPPG
jgi:histidine triad (HIT) family protein